MAFFETRVERRSEYGVPFRDERSRDLVVFLGGIEQGCNREGPYETSVPDGSSFGLDSPIVELFVPLEDFALDHIDTEDSPHSASLEVAGSLRDLRHRLSVGDFEGQLLELPTSRHRILGFRINAGIWSHVLGEARARQHVGRAPVARHDVSPEQIVEPRVRESMGLVRGHDANVHVIDDFLSGLRHREPFVDGWKGGARRPKLLGHDTNLTRRSELGKAEASPGIKPRCAGPPGCKDTARQCSIGESLRARARTGTGTVRNLASQDQTQTLSDLREARDRRKGCIDFIADRLEPCGGAWYVPCFSGAHGR